MSTIQPNTHSFIVKVWLVESQPTTGRVVWRGRITHVPSGEIRYFAQVNEIADCLMPYLEQLSEPPPRWWQVRRWRMRRWWMCRWLGW